MPMKKPRGSKWATGFRVPSLPLGGVITEPERRIGVHEFVNGGTQHKAEHETEKSLGIEVRDYVHSIICTI